MRGNDFDPRFPDSLQNQQPQQPQQPSQQQYGKPQKPPGQTMVLVAGILMIISGGFGLMITGLAFLAALVVDLEHSVVFGTEVPDMALLGFGLLLAAVTLGFGIGGVVLRKKPGAGQTIVTLGMVLIAARVVDTVIGLGTEVPDVGTLGLDGGVFEAGYLAGYYFGLFIGIVISFIPPILYVTGGNQLKKRS
jgi:hypothetical protein